MGRQRLAKYRAYPPNLYQNPAGYFYYRNPVDKTQRGLGRDKAKAFQAARAANAALATREPSSLVDWVLGKTDYTLAGWLPLYRQLWEEKTKPAPSTIANTASFIKKIEASDMAKFRLREITTAHVAEYLEECSAGGGAGSVRNLRTKLSDIFRWAETQGLIEVGKNPVTATFSPAYKVKRERLSLEQFWQIHAHAPTWLQRAMVIALTTGQRRDDISNMKFADLKDGYLQVVQGKSGGDVRLQLDVNIRLAKVGISIGEAVAACRDMIVSRYLIHHVAHIGPSKPGQKVVADGLSDGFARAREKAGIMAEEGRSPPSFHEIRSLAQRLYREEFGAAFAQAMLGHKSAATTNKYDDLRGGWMTISSK